MQKLLVVLVGLALLPVVAWALSLNVSSRLPPLVNKIRPAALVDEAGNVVFGSLPGKVEVTNPTTGGTTVFTVYGTATCPAGFAMMYSGAVYQWSMSSSFEFASDGKCWQSVPGAGWTRQPAIPVGPCAVCVG